MLGLLILVGGGALTGWGVLNATGARRPLDLVGAVAAAVGLGIAMLGALTLAVPGFLG